MRYTVIIEEMISQEFEVDAGNIDDAMKSAKEKYANGEFVLAPGNLVCKQMCAESVDKRNVRIGLSFELIYG